VQACIDHWTANFGAPAGNHFTYFDSSLPDLNDNPPSGYRIRYASAHIFVDRHEALELIPLDEVAFHGNERVAGPLLPALKATSTQYPGGNANLLTIGIEMCVEKDGTIHPDTLRRTALVHQMLQKRFPQLKDTYNRFVRHYDVTGKPCPRPMVDKPASYKQLLDMTHGVIPINPVPTKPATPPKEEPFMLEKAVVINSFADYPTAETLANRLNCPIFTRNVAYGKQVAKEVFVVGGTKDDLKADKFTVLSGNDRFETAANVKKYIG
jgi:N-acetylmuramoyl-L-alanine amidase